MVGRGLDDAFLVNKNNYYTSKFFQGGRDYMLHSTDAINTIVYCV